MNDVFGYNLLPGGQMITGRDYVKYMDQEISCNQCFVICQRWTWGRYSGYCVSCAQESGEKRKILRREKAKLDAREYRKQKGCKSRDVDKPKKVSYKLGDNCPCKKCGVEFVKDRLGAYSPYCLACDHALRSESKRRRMIKDREASKKYRTNNKELVSAKAKERYKTHPRKPKSLEQKARAAARLREYRKNNPEKFKEYENRRCPIKRREQRKGRERNLKMN